MDGGPHRVVLTGRAPMGRLGSAVSLVLNRIGVGAPG